MKRLLSTLCLSLSLAACGAESEQLSPVTTASGSGDAGATTTTSTTTSTTETSPDGGATVKRTVMQRNPFGERANNHLIDGDFEMSTSIYGGQMGWRAFTKDGSGEIGLAVETGGLCHSGLRCAVMEPSTLILMRGASAKGKGNVASGWAKLPEGQSCSKIKPILIDCDTYVLTKQLPVKGTIDGWCHYAAVIGDKQNATCVYVENSLAEGTTALLDSFVLGPDDGTIQPLSAEFWAPEADTMMRLETLKAHITATTPYGRKPPPPRIPTP